MLARQSLKSVAPNVSKRPLKAARPVSSTSCSFCLFSERSLAVRGYNTAQVSGSASESWSSADVSGARHGRARFRRARWPASRQRGDDSSIFSPDESAMDHIFENVDNTPSLVPKASSAAHTASQTKNPRRYSISARERDSFDQMFNLIFEAVAEQKGFDNPSRTSSPIAGIGQSRKIVDLVGTLRHYSKNLKWTTEADEELDRKKEEMDLCDTDHQLLEWALREVFGESKRYEEEAQRVMYDPSATRENLQLQPLAYPHLLATLMRTFRDRYLDPHLALSMFDYARYLSIPSYVFGCTTPAYNELIETRWKCFRDLRGVCDALEEMRVNGVEMDNRTRNLAETIRHEVGERNLWEEETTKGSGEVWQMVSLIEALTAGEPEPAKDSWKNKTKKWAPGREVWKAKALRDTKDGWEFGKWEDPDWEPQRSYFQPAELEGPLKRLKMRA